MLAACTLLSVPSCFSAQDYEEPLMFCLNEEDEEDDLLETLTGSGLFYSFSPRVHLGSPRATAEKSNFLSLFFANSPFGDICLLTPEV